MKAIKIIGVALALLYFGWWVGWFVSIGLPELIETMGSWKILTVN